MIRALPAELARVIAHLKARIAARPDSEFQQALIRFFIGLGFFLYFASSWFRHPEAVSIAIYQVVVVFMPLSALILVATLASPKVSVFRRVFGAVLDFSTASILLYVGGETSAPLVTIYLWVTLGNGFRYGVKYLYLSTLLASLGFALVLSLNEFWRGHLPLGLGVMLAVVAVPLYAASLMRQLHSAVAREKEANKAKSQFLANISHELRTPLNGVIGVADLLAETRLDREQHELAQVIRASADTLLGLIDNVLDFSRIEAGRLILADEPFDLHLLVNRTVQMLDPVAKKKGIALAAHITPQTPFRLNGDAPHLRQVLINLIGNAIKFTEAGRVDLYVRPSGLGDPPRLHFEVVDTGIGIAAPVQDTIFQSFTQADTSITRRYGGTGLGTTIAKQLVELMGGRIGLRSEEGVGSVFWFEIPFQTQATSAASSSAELPLKGRVALLARGELLPRLDELVRTWGLDVQPLASDEVARSAIRNASSSNRSLTALVVAQDCLNQEPLAYIESLELAEREHSLPIILIIPESSNADAALSDTRLTRAGYAAVLSTPVNASLLFNAIHAVMSTALPDNVVSIADHFQSRAGGLKLRILVADDNPVNLRVTRGIMEHAGHEVLAVNDGEQALALLEAENDQIDLAIIDMQMPGLSGPDVVRHWRFMEQEHLPIVILTADAREESARTCREAGADAFLTKPINGLDLIDTVARLAMAAGSGENPGQQAKRRPVARLDEETLDDLATLGGGPEFVEGLIREFTQDSLRALGAIEQALKERDYLAWKDQCHTLKGGASDVGALELAQLCAEAERIQPYELGSAVSRERLNSVRDAWTAAGTALADYLSRQASARRH
ncbi:MAG: response regulator [Hydrogenophilales bacterium]|nr:response regulator [Hydrogenophilales bacterium]